MRVAAIDIGTNSVHLLVAEVHPDGQVQVIEKAREQVMLGSGGLGASCIADDAFARGVAAMEHFKEACDSHGVHDIHAAATSAVREAENGSEFCRVVKRQTGIHVRVISGVDEARLIWRGHQGHLDFTHGRVMIFDLGGGSTEFILADPRHALLVESLPLGHIRLAEAFHHADPMSEDDRQTLKRHIRKVLKPLRKRVGKQDVGSLVGASGTVRCLARMATLARGEPLPEHSHGLLITRKEVEALIARFQSLPKDELETLPGMDPKRRDTLPAGAVLVREVMKALSVSQLTSSDRSLRDGLIADWIHRNRPELDLAASVRAPRERSVLLTMKRFGVDETHAHTVADMALQLFDALAPLHLLPVTDRELLRVGSLLHDIGHHIAGKGHHKHGQYLLKHIRLYGYTAPEVAVLSNLVRYHSRSKPKRSHRDFGALSKEDRHRVRLLAGLLKIADGLDRSHNQPIHRLEVEAGDPIRLTAYSHQRADLERWEAPHRTGLLSRTLGRPVEIRVVSEDADTPDEDDDDDVSSPGPPGMTPSARWAPEPQAEA